MYSALRIDRRMLGIIVLLEYPISSLEQKISGSSHGSSQYVYVLILVHYTVDQHKFTHPMGGEAPPHHNFIVMLDAASDSKGAVSL